MRINPSTVLLAMFVAAASTPIDKTASRDLEIRGVSNGATPPAHPGQPSRPLCPPLAKAPELEKRLTDLQRSMTEFEQRHPHWWTRVRQKASKMMTEQMAKVKGKASQSRFEQKESLRKHCEELKMLLNKLKRSESESEHSNSESAYSNSESEQSNLDTVIVIEDDSSNPCTGSTSDVKEQVEGMVEQYEGMVDQVMVAMDGVGNIGSEVIDQVANIVAGLLNFGADFLSALGDS
ncbi:hypothetical protein F5878DRAFT_656545 [Lentinula raphanica]|uniref:Uncharacterized protein n=1 Tax=Lentinula raphanica TaxID=153919 RepID=A0AA38PIN8_9AGAR|nr:hypothetical protein F5880DRAFT_1613345 [Lentinula raphanica]KAJ3843619.1 hypothetical protein F5878DRAFT_656545 [Lentinula raphanica]